MNPADVTGNENEQEGHFPLLRWETRLVEGLPSPDHLLQGYSPFSNMSETQSLIPSAF